MYGIVHHDDKDLLRTSTLTLRFIVEISPLKNIMKNAKENNNKKKKKHKN